MFSKKGFLSAFLFSVVYLTSSWAHADQERLTLTRQTSSGALLEATLSRDVFRSIPYQDTYEEQEAYQAEETYTVEVPYQTEETYYVDVPYQEQESYLDTETYYDNEYRCRTVTEYERVCRNERMCSREPGDQVCREVQECGHNARGEQICKTRKVCDRGPDRESCRDQQVCNSVPRSREKCGYEQVRKTRTVTRWRTVTKYRQEPRTRTVTRTRSEQRTRTVTKYRTVTKCCVTKYRQEYERTWDLKVQVLFPKQAILLKNEAERFELILKGSEAQPDVELRIVDSIFGYTIARKSIQKGSGQIELGLTPKYNEKNLGEKLIERAELFASKTETLNEIMIQDKGIVPRVISSYRYQIIESMSKNVVAQGELSSVSAVKGVVSGRLSQELPSDVDYTLQVAIARTGIVLEKPISFAITRDIKFTRWKAEDFGEKTIKAAALEESKDVTKLTFIDEGAHPKLVTQYRVMVLKKSGDSVSTQDFNAAEALDAKNRVSLTVDKKALELEEDLVVRLLVQRTGKRLDKAVQFHQDLERRYISREELQDRQKVTGLTIAGQQTQARLIFVDQIVDTNQIVTEYTVIIRRPGGFLNMSKKVLAELKLKQGKGQKGQFDRKLIDLGLRAKDLERHVQAGQVLSLELVVQRKSKTDNKVLATIRKSEEVKVQ
ncbi:MAG: hypothetical protein ACK5Y2_01945 [Bdellovibrionales bacterium]